MTEAIFGIRRFERVTAVSLEEFELCDVHFDGR